MSKSKQDRQDLARDVHDALGGDLAAIKMALAVLARRLPQDQALWEQWAYVDKLVDGAIDSMHRVLEKSQHMPPGRLDQVAAQQVADFGRQSGLSCTQNLAEVALDMQSPVAQALYYILRECLSNVGKHAKATQVRVALRVAQERLVLEVEDDGIGLREQPRQGFGLQGMRKRATELGGEFSLRTIVPHGTLIVIEIPLRNIRA